MSFTKAGLAAFHAWTHDCLDQVFQHAAALPPELLSKELSGFGQATIRGQLAHLLACETGWVRGLQGLPALASPFEDCRTAVSLIEAKRQVAAGTRMYLESLTDAQLNSPLAAVPEAWVGPPRSPAYILHHVLTHAFHHKCQVVAMFRILGDPAPDTDMQRVR